MLGLVSFDFQSYSTVADHYLYLPMLGVALCAAWFWNWRFQCRDASTEFVEVRKGAVCARPETSCKFDHLSPRDGLSEPRP